MNSKLIQNLLALSQNSYNLIATNFDATRKKEIWPMIREVAAAVKSDERVLDAGCGNGRLLEVFADRKIDYLGIDSSLELIKLAKKNYPQAKFLVAELINLSVADLEKFGGKKFNYVFCLAVLQHIPSHELRTKVLKSLREFLLPNGELIISNWNLWHSAHRRLIFKQALKKLLGTNKMDFGDIVFPWKKQNGEIVSDRYYHAFSKQELLRVAKDAGFSEIVYKKDKYNYWLILRQ